MAIANIPVTTTNDGHFAIPVTYINLKNNKSIKLNVLPDTGSTVDFIALKSVRLLGLQLDSAAKTTAVSFGKATHGGFYRHILSVKIGNLKPVSTLVNIDTNPDRDTNVLGIFTMLNFKKVTFTGKYLRFEENDAATTIQKQAAMADAYRSFYGYQRWYRKRI